MLCQHSFPFYSFPVLFILSFLIFLFSWIIDRLIVKIGIKTISGGKLSASEGITASFVKNLFYRNRSNRPTASMFFAALFFACFRLDGLPFILYRTSERRLYNILFSVDKYNEEYFMFNRQTDLPVKTRRFA